MEGLENFYSSDIRLKLQRFPLGKGISNFPFSPLTGENCAQNTQKIGEGWTGRSLSIGERQIFISPKLLTRFKNGMGFGRNTLRVTQDIWSNLIWGP